MNKEVNITCHIVCTTWKKNTTASCQQGKMANTCDPMCLWKSRN